MLPHMLMGFSTNQSLALYYARWSRYIKTFMLTVQFMDPKTTSVDIVANIKGRDQVVQTTRINVTKNVMKIP